MNKFDKLILFLIGLYILLVPLVPTTRYEWSLSFLFVIIGLIYIVELSIDKNMRKNFSLKVRNIFYDRFTMLFICLIIIMALSTFYSDNKTASLKETIRYIYYLAIYLLIRFRIDTEILQEKIVKVYMSSTLIVGLIGLYEYIFIKSSLGIEYIINVGRIKSTLSHYNAYGAYLVLAIFPAIMLSIKSFGKKKILYILLSGILIINLALTFSRNSWLALAVGILLLTVVYKWQFIFLCIIPAVYGALNPNIIDKIRALRTAGINEGRLKLWKVAEKIIDENLFLGVGSGNFTTAYKEYSERFPEYKIGSLETLAPHNSYIKFFAELGIFGAMVFLLMCMEIANRIYMQENTQNKTVDVFYRGYLISAICFFIMNCFDDLFFAPKVTINFIIFISIAFTRPIRKVVK